MKRFGLGALLALAVATPASADQRWPVWPTELDRLTEPLFDISGTPEAERYAAFLGLYDYATPVIEEVVIRAADDPAPQIRRDALELCAIRGLVGCIPAAVRAWNVGGDTIERMHALKVIALEPTEARALVLFSALRDPDESMRVRAVRLVGKAPFDASGREEAIKQLLAKLTDASARVRADAADGLAHLGGEEGSLAIVRLLEDPDPTVRESAARALGRFADPRTRPALLRAIDRGGTPHFVRDAVGSLAAIPGDEVDSELLRLLDEPPQTPNNRAYVADAIGRRSAPGPALIDGLIDRLRGAHAQPTHTEDQLRRAVLQALLHLGDAALPAMRSAIERGVEPSLELELRSLIAAREIPTEGTVVRTSLPETDDRSGWHELLRQRDLSLEETGLDPGTTDAHAVDLAARSPKWLGSAVRGAIARAGRPADARPWLIAAAAAPDALLDGRDDRFAWMRLASWATDTAASAEDRCLALAALGAAAGTRHAKVVTESLAQMPGASSSTVRSCAALTLGRLGEERALRLLLRDSSPQVRAGAALAATSVRRPGRTLRVTLAALAHRDPSSQVRTAAAWARTKLGSTPGPAVLVRHDRPRAWHEPAGWASVRSEGQLVMVPVVGPPAPAPSPQSRTAPNPGRRWALVPGLVEPEIERPGGPGDPAPSRIR